MNRTFVAGLGAGIALAGVMAVSAAQPAQTIQACGALLPAGHTFELNIEGTIDTSVSERVFRGNFGVSDGSGKPNRELQKSVQPFVECVKPLLK